MPRIVGRSRQRSILLTRVPVDEVLDTAGEGEVPFGDTGGVVGEKTHVHAAPGEREFRMVPCGLRQVADGIGHHQRALPAFGAIAAAQLAALKRPSGEGGVETTTDRRLVKGNAGIHDRLRGIG